MLKIKSPVVGDFYGTGIEIWAAFGLVGITRKKGPIMNNFRGRFFHVFMDKKKEKKLNIL
jgi:hypothetical protein